MSDFTYDVDRVVEEEIKYNTLVTQFENGYEQRRRKWANPLRMFKLQCKFRTQTEMENLRDFFTGKYGSYTSFTWTNPNDSTEYTVRYDEDSLKIERVAYQIYNASFNFVEVK